MSHVHVWEPWVRGRGQYLCSCGVAGYRHRGIVLARARPAESAHEAAEWDDAHAKVSVVDRIPQPWDEEEVPCV